MTNKLIAIIQARMGSTRLLGKVLKPILDKPVLRHIVNRLRSVKKIDRIVVATSVQLNDDQIEEFCSSENIEYFRGSEDDVLDRFYQVAVQYEGDPLIRITGDCSLIEPNLISQLICYSFDNDFDYCGIATGAGVAEDGFEGRYPDGLDAEIFTMRALTVAWQEAQGLLCREHVTPFIWKQPDRFKLGTLGSEDKDYSNLRWTLDNQEDYYLIQWIYEKLLPTNPSFDMYDVLRLLSKHPERFRREQIFDREGRL